jgi:hypothetical protein
MKRLKESGTPLILRGYDGEAAKQTPRRKPNYAQGRRNAVLALIAGVLLITMPAWYLDGTDEISFAGSGSVRWTWAG